ncbi:ABC transporter substrate-binding protein [Rhodococcus wratislaviensis]|uniref:Putative ABC transporter substrate-binding protein n=1 Tax=Rhodococcus wratislaviensis NBRC 100605 TaxID=1219028 RepID=X0QUY3_RHOWR|nr:ABC transporter substrate-binding protein [Rhodococcus wratislaviensis]GAF42430.1 putative ABC transporter substrate-binding protein [Rhodococcus wratislaviensis NBRC 100605]
MRVRGILVAAVCAALAVGTAGCTANSDAGEASNRQTTVDHHFGTTTVEGTPSRIVATSSQWVDALLEFGVQPVAYLSAGAMGDERGLYPWESEVDDSAVELDRASMTQMGASLPEEHIGGFAPDLILGSFAVADQEDFDRISKIAPTVAALGDVQVDPWESQVEVLGRILGEEDRAAEIIANTNGTVDGLADRLPALSRKTAVLPQFVFATGQLVVVADPDDGASAVFRRLGLTLPPTLVEEAGATGGRLTLSPERVDALNADLVVMLPNGGTRDDLMRLAGFAQLPSVQQGGLAVEDYATVVGFNTPSSLSLQCSLGRITPQLEAVGA